MVPRFTHCSVLAAIPLLASASPQSAPDLFDMALEDLIHVRVVTASRKAESLDQAPGTVLVVTRTQIQQRGYTNLLDVLRDLPGIDVHSYHYGINSDALTWRGVYGNQKFIILQDGLRISPTASEPFAITQNYPLYHARQVEIVYGPASALYGADAMTGVINIITDADNDHERGEARLAGGRNGTRYGSLFVGHTFAPGWRLAAGADYAQSDGADLGRQYPDLFQLTDLRRFDGSLAVAAAERKGFNAPLGTRSAYLNLSAPHGFRAGFNHSSLNSLTTRSEAPNKVDYGAQPQWNFSIDNADLRYRHAFTPQASTEVTVAYSRTAVDPVSSFFNQVTAFGHGYKYSLSEAWTLSQTVDWQFSQRHGLVAGYSAERLTSIPLTADLPAQYDSARAPDAQQLYYAGTKQNLPIRIFHVAYKSAGVFGQVKSNWSEAWSSTLGVRADHNNAYGNSFTPRLSMVYVPSVSDTLKLHYGAAFLAPSPFLTYRHFGTFSGSQDAQGRYLANSFFLPNPDLKPETMKLLELRYSRQLTPALRFEASVYRQRVKDFIATSATPSVQSDFIAGGLIGATRHNANVGALAASGAELGLSYDTNIGAGRARLWANYSRVDGKLTLPGRESGLPLTARDKLKLGASYQAGRVTLSPSVYLIGTTHGALGTDQSGVPGYLLVNLYASVGALREGVDLFAHVDNLLDRRYYNATLVGASNQFVQSPQPLRTIRAGLNVRF
jgi:outer membrane receptor for ferrienterochelin and colicins